MQQMHKLLICFKSEAQFFVGNPDSATGMGMRTAAADGTKQSDRALPNKKSPACAGL